VGLLENKNSKSSLPERVASLVANNLPLPTMSQGGYLASGDGISVPDHLPLAGNTLGTLWLPCLLVPLWSSGSFGSFLVWWEWEYFIDLFLCSARITVFADALFVNPLSIVE